MEISEGKLLRLSAAFAISNMGHEVPKDIAESPFVENNRYASPRSEICNWAGHLMETDEHEEIFAGEAEMWYNDLKSQSNEEVLSVWGESSPWLKRIIEA